MEAYVAAETAQGEPFTPGHPTNGHMNYTMVTTW